MIKYIEYIETDGSPITYQFTHGCLSSVDDVIYFDFMPLTGTARYDGWYNFVGYNNMFSIGTYGGGYSFSQMNIGFGNSTYGTRPTLTANTKYECVLNKTGFTANELSFPFAKNADSVGTASEMLLNGAFNGSTTTPTRCSIARYYGLKIVSNGTVLCDYRPVLDDNDAPCFYDEVSQTLSYHYGTGTPTAGPVLHIFYPSKTLLRFDATGGTETVEIEAETTWTASTPSFVSVSPSTGDTGTTQVTISCPSYSGETRREDVITFTDNDDYTLTFKARQNGNSAGFSNIYLGDNNLLSNTIFLGDNAVNTIYLGEEIIYSNGPFVGLKAAPKSLGLTNTTNTANITIRSSENWTITDDSNGWLSYSTTTGTTGKTVVTVTASTTQADRTATITVTSANYSATISVSQVVGLPSKTFWVNYNAKKYNSTTLTLPKENGQLFNEDLVLPGAVTFNNDYITITGDKRIHFAFNNTSDNIFNRTTNTASITIIAKTSNGRSTWFVSNRSNVVGWMVSYSYKNQMAWTGDDNAYTSSTSPMILTWRCGNGTQQYIAHSDNVTGTPYQITAWVGNETKDIYFFGGNISSENWTGDFYWLYISPETLTDAEIQAVIDYNENL